MKETYITAILQKIESGSKPDEMLQGLQKTLKQRGHERLYASVLRGVVRVLEAGSREVALATVATEKEFAVHKEAITKALHELGADVTPKVHIDDTIVGGFVVEANAQRYDASFKSKLVTLYRSLTK